MRIEQPKGVFLIACTQAWESFSFYGMRALLALYLISQLHYPDKSAFALYALYIALVEVGAGVGGYLADRFLGYRGAVLFGGGFITLGHICMIFSASLPLFFLGLGCIITGATLFRSNLKALMGLLYKKEDERRESGFTLLYAAINVGGFSAALLCGILANLYGWHVGFGIAALGMIVGIAIFAMQSSLFKEVDIQAKTPIVFPLIGGVVACIGFAYALSQFQVTSVCLLPITIVSFGVLVWILARKMAAKLILKVVGVLLLLVSYFSVEELMGSLLMVFSENYVHRSLFGIEIPSSILIAINPLVVMMAGPLLAGIHMKLRKRFSIAFVCLSLAFIVLYAATLTAFPSVLYVMIGFGLIALGELFLAPAVFSFCSKAAPEKGAGLMMGLVTLAFSLASLLSGQTSQLPYEPSTLFLAIGILSALLSLILLLEKRKRKQALI